MAPMNKRSPAVYSYFYEHLFFDAVQRYNSLELGPRISTSEARRIRQMADDVLKANNRAPLNDVTDQKDKVQDVRRAINWAFNKSRQVSQHLGENIVTDATYKQSLTAFTTALGLPQSQVNEQGQKITVMPDKGGLEDGVLISPYDPRLSTRKAALDLGSRQGVMTVEQIETLLGGDIEGLHRYTAPGLMLHSIENSDTGPYLKKVGDTYQKDDASGLVRLKKYMSEKDYRVASHWMLYGEQERMSDAAYQRAEAILEHLQQTGTEYSVIPDMKEGQLAVALSGTGIQVRLVENREQEAYVGRVYDRGAILYYSTNHRVKLPDGKFQYSRYEPNTADVLALIDLAQGKPVFRPDGAGRVGQQVTRPAVRDGVQFTGHEVYYKDRTQIMAYGSLGALTGQNYPSWARVNIRKDATNRSSGTTFMKDAQAAEDFLAQAIVSAEARFEKAVDREMVYGAMAQTLQTMLNDGVGFRHDPFGENMRVYDASINEYVDAEDLVDVEVLAEIKQGLKDSLVDVDEKVTEARHVLVDDLWNHIMREEQAQGVTIEDQVRGIDYGPYQVTEDFREMIEQLEAGTLRVKALNPEILTPMGEYFENGQRNDELEVLSLNPVMVARYMDSSFGQWRNNADIIKALRLMDQERLPQLLGDDYYLKTVQDKLVRFDEASAVRLGATGNPFYEEIGQHIHQSLVANGLEEVEISLDTEHGIYRWSGKQARDFDGEHREISGEIGQVFAQGQYGEVVTQYASGENYMFVPGYEARILAQKPGENLSVEERTRLVGYTTKLKDAISYQLSASVLMNDTYSMTDPTALNSVYSNLYDTRHEVDFIERAQEEGLSKEWVERILATEASAVRYPNSVKEGSTVHAEYSKSRAQGVDIDNDNYFDAYQLTGKRNMAIIGAESSGYFDPVMTGSGTNQGSIRYLVHDARVAEDGSIIKGTEGAGTFLLEHPDAQWMKYDPADRRQMTASNLMQAKAVTEPSKTAMMTLEGWTYEDGIVISERFAQQHQIRGVDGVMRPLMVGDKLSDMHGNKGVISHIADPEKDSLTSQVFRDNPELDVVMSPFSAVSRFNAGSGRELMQNPSDLVLPDGRVAEGGVGEARFIVTHMSVDAKTKVYDDEAYAEGKGRAASSQLAWTLQSNGASALLKEMYGPNLSALTKLREHVQVLGFDITETGKLVNGYRPHEGENRQVFEVAPSLLAKNGSLRTTAMVNEFGARINKEGGLLKLPFQVTMASGVASDTIPVMSASLRSSQDLADGTSTTHEYTNNYLKMYECAAKYNHLSEKLENESSQQKVVEMRRQMGELVSRAQSAYGSMANSIEQRSISGKHNAIKEGLMKRKLPRSATAVWTGDARLGLNEIGVSAQMAESLGARDGDPLVLWRDPQLRGSGVRCFKAKVLEDEQMPGIAINPVLVSQFDGDFDGDSVGIYHPVTGRGRMDAQSTLMMDANLLDKGVMLEDDTYPLAVASNLDIKVAHHYNPELAEEFEALRLAANDADFDLHSDDVDFGGDEWLAANQVILEKLEEHYQKCFEASTGKAVISFKDPQAHIESIRQACIETGAKGSDGKLNNYTQYAGYRDRSGVVDYQKSDGYYVTQQDLDDTQQATAIKSFGTGNAGAVSQRGVKALREQSIEAVLEATYGATQAILQAKHDPVEARIRYEAIMGPSRALWNGEKIAKGQDGTWRAVSNKGKPVMMTAKEWVETYEAFAKDPQGLNVPINREHLETLAEIMVDDKGIVRGIEETAEGATAMDQLAYGGDLDTLKHLANCEADLFEGRLGSTFRPYVVQENIRRTQDYERQLMEVETAQELASIGVPIEVPEPERVALKPLIRKDTQVRVVPVAPVAETTAVVESEVGGEDVEYDL